MSTSIGLAVTGLDLVSDAIFIIFLLGGSFIPVTAGVRVALAIFIIVRFLHPFTFVLTIGSLFGIILPYSATINTITSTTTRYNGTSVVD